MKEVSEDWFVSPNDFAEWASDILAFGKGYVEITPEGYKHIPHGGIDCTHLNDSLKNLLKENSVIKLLSQSKVQEILEEAEKMCKEDTEGGQ